MSKVLVSEGQAFVKGSGCEDGVPMMELVPWGEEASDLGFPDFQKSMSEFRPPHWWSCVIAAQ